MNYKPGTEEYISLSNYKAPFRPAKDGYGAQGVQEMHKSGEQLLCKVCGDWFGAMTGHLIKHNITAKEYKDQFGIMRGTALVNEKVRVRLVINGYKRYEENLKGIQHKPSEIIRANITRKKLRKIQGNRALESRNIKGICFDQILDKIVSLTDQIGHTPSRILFCKS